MNKRQRRDLVEICETHKFEWSIHNLNLYLNIYFILCEYHSRILICLLRNRFQACRPADKEQDDTAFKKHLNIQLPPTSSLRINVKFTADDLHLKASLRYSLNDDAYRINWSIDLTSLTTQQCVRYRIVTQFPSFLPQLSRHNPTHFVIGKLRLRYLSALLPWRCILH